MHLRKGSAEISVLEAVDHLSHMAELDKSLPEDARAAEESTEEELRERMQALSWHDPQYYTYNRERVKETFRALLKYVKDLYEKDKGYLKDPETQRGIQAMMLLASEAAQKIDMYTDIFKGDKEVESVTELKEFKEFQHFYLTKVVQRFQTIVETEEKWHEEWGAAEERLDVQKPGLKSVDSVRKDEEYELFLIRREDGSPFFNPSLMHHIQLVGQFDQLLGDGKRENLFLRTEMIRDRDLHMFAKEALDAAHPYIDEYYKEALKFKKSEFAASLSKALMALMLAANAHNVMQNTTGKTALKYFADFHFYLRLALRSEEGRRLRAMPREQVEPFFQLALSLSQELAFSLFLGIGSRKEMVAFVRMLIEKGAKESIVEKETMSPTSLWNTLLDDDHCLRTVLKRYPNGPLRKSLEMLHEGAILSGFDPMAQGNIPGQMYTLVGEDLHISCLRLPSPTSQERIDKADIVPEFLGFLRALGSHTRRQRHLLINLQDRTTWLEHARCAALEGAREDSTLIVVTVPKHTEFYLQSGDYLAVDDAKEFIAQLKEQIASAENCGFYIPKEIDRKELQKFTAQAAQTIHTLFFADKPNLVHKNRLDFIEIFIQMLTLKLIEMCRPDTLSFTCKDGVDVGAASNAQMFAFLRMMNHASGFSKEEKDLLFWLIYAPALSLRERAIDAHPLNRMVSALAVVSGELEAHRHEVVAACGKLYRLPFFQGVSFKI